MVPRSAVQSLGAKQVVYVATSEPGVFIQRDVTTGAEAGGTVAVYSGLNAGERDEAGIQTVNIVVSEKGFEPSTIRLKRDIPARLTFVRKIEETCATEVVIADFGITRDLPLNKSVVIEFTPNKTGEFNFACEMNMVGGKIVVR
jgi:hypothetical protein